MPRDAPCRAPLRAPPARARSTCCQLPPPRPLSLPPSPPPFCSVRHNEFSRRGEKTKPRVVPALPTVCGPLPALGVGDARGRRLRAGSPTLRETFSAQRPRRRCPFPAPAPRNGPYGGAEAGAGAGRGPWRLRARPMGARLGSRGESSPPGQARRRRGCRWVVVKYIYLLLETLLCSCPPPAPPARTPRCRFASTAQASATVAGAARRARCGAEGMRSAGTAGSRPPPPPDGCGRGGTERRPPRSSPSANEIGRHGLRSAPNPPPSSPRAAAALVAADRAVPRTCWRERPDRPRCAFFASGAKSASQRSGRRREPRCAVRDSAGGTTRGGRCAG